MDPEIQNLAPRPRQHPAAMDNASLVWQRPNFHLPNLPTNAAASQNPTSRPSYRDVATQTDFPRLIIRLPAPAPKPVDVFLHQPARQLPSQSRALKLRRQRELRTCVDQAAELFNVLQEETWEFSAADRDKLLSQARVCLSRQHEVFCMKDWWKLRALCKDKWRGRVTAIGREYASLRREYKRIVQEIERKEVVVIFKTERFREQVEMMSEQVDAWYDADDD
ncbi:uncharacterized protein BDZ99DRAFT_565605 [Mytilinidion resinicola]|uniref:Uncharacterized protein n=1 Tax=Mytilinidion resinicola TaxID=574789 RepID=A0A6A6Z4I3_9PEZI|nr:uncharacterized protein BDZ99DRAFT_565605 [Mytilinidion resinicola]KAF2815649.1 hypothetical protein BDZ99DRAFT_565605 [Mytilinidion resinicola]